MIFENFDFSVLDDPDYLEDSVREDIITPILKKLGYGPSGRYKIIRSKRVTHPFVKTGTTERKIENIPDYLISIDGRYAFVLDAKAPNENIGDHIEQVYFYSIHPEIRTKYYSLSNGREIILYDIHSEKSVLHIQISEIDKHWSKIEEFLSPLAFELQYDKREELKAKKKPEFDYMSQTILQPELPVRKQAARRHFGVHGYFTKQVWNVVQEYIKNFTEPGDLVLDPFGGSGVTAIESLMLDRKAIHIDLNPMSPYLVENLIRPVDLNRLTVVFYKVCEKFLKGKPESQEEIEEALKKYDYPKGVKLMANADVQYIEELFTDKQLAQLAFLRSIIFNIKEVDIRNSLLIAFSSSINKFNKTFHYTKSDGGGDSSVFRYYRFRIAPDPGQLELIDIFRVKFNFLKRAKKELSMKIDEDNFKNDVVIRKGSATNLEFIPTESIDYIYTDPPYGAKIPYLDLSILWNSWLKLDVSKEDFELEAIEGGEHGKSEDEYSYLLQRSIEEAYRVLKFNRWMSFVFAHKDPKFWHLIVNTAENFGFEYAGAVQQNNGQTSFKKRQNPFSVLSGQLIINFKKVKTPQTIQKAKLGGDIFELVIETIESTIARFEGATLEQINDELIMKGLEFGFLDILSSQYKDLTPILTKNFDYNEEDQKFHLNKEQKFKTQLDVNLRIKYYLLAFLRRCERNKITPTTDEIILHIMPLLKNGITPENQTILNVLKRVANQVEKNKWIIKESGQLDMNF